MTLLSTKLANSKGILLFGFVEFYSMNVVNKSWLELQVSSKLIKQQKIHFI